MIGLGPVLQCVIQQSWSKVIGLCDPNKLLNLILLLVLGPVPYYGIFVFHAHFQCYVSLKMSMIKHKFPIVWDMEEDGNLLGSHKPVALFQLCWIRL